MRTKRLGDMLIELGLLTNDQLKQALEFQAKEKDRLGTTLINLETLIPSFQLWMMQKSLVK